MDITPYVGTIATVIIAIGGVYAAISSRLARLETMIEALTQTVEKHNRIVERTYKLENDMHTAFKSIDDLKDETKRLDEKKADR